MKKFISILVTVILAISISAKAEVTKEYLEEMAFKNRQTVWVEEIKTEEILVEELTMENIETEKIIVEGDFDLPNVKAEPKWYEKVIDIIVFWD